MMTWDPILKRLKVTKMDALYLTEIMMPECIQMIYELWYEGHTNLLMWFYLWKYWSLGEAIESVYLIWKS